MEFCSVLLLSVSLLWYYEWTAFLELLTDKVGFFGHFAISPDGCIWVLLNFSGNSELLSLYLDIISDF